MYCKNCNSKIPDNFKFCPKCGSPVDDSEQKQDADQQGSSNSKNDKKKILINTLIVVIVCAAVAACLLLVFLPGKNSGRLTENEEGAEIQSEAEAENTAEDAEESEGSVEEQDEEPIEEETDPEEELIEVVEEMSPDQIKQAAKDLYNDLVACSASDPDEFAEYYVNATEDEVQSDLEYFSEIESDGNEKQIATVIIESAPSAAVQVDSYKTEDESFDLTDDFIMTYTESGWKKDLSEDVRDQIYSSENMEEVYPEAYMQAFDADRNAYQFDSCFLYLDDTAVYEGEFRSELAFLSQDEYDCLTAYVWMGNGTEEEIRVNEISLTITDAELGPVLDQTVSHEETVDAGHSELVQLHFDEPSKILTGTDEWTELEASVFTAYKEEDAAQTEQETNPDPSNDSTDNTAEVQEGGASQTEQESGSNASNSSADTTMVLPDLYAETEYDIDAYCAALRDEYQDLGLSASILFEDANLVFIGVDYYDKDNGNERRGCVAVPRTSAGSDKTIDDYLCSKCSGKGVILEQGTDTQVCSICGGTGQQYIPNAIYDVVMGWMGQYVVCSGCGGSGYINYTTEYYVWCDQCNGYTVAK